MMESSKTKGKESAKLHRNLIFLNAISNIKKQKAPPVIPSPPSLGKDKCENVSFETIHSEQNSEIIQSVSRSFSCPATCSQISKISNVPITDNNTNHKDFSNTHSNNDFITEPQNKEKKKNSEFLNSNIGSSNDFKHQVRPINNYKFNTQPNHKSELCFNDEQSFQQMKSASSNILPCTIDEEHIEAEKYNKYDSCSAYPYISKTHSNYEYCTHSNSLRNKAKYSRGNSATGNIHKELINSSYLSKESLNNKFSTSQNNNSLQKTKSNVDVNKGKNKSENFYEFSGINYTRKISAPNGSLQISVQRNNQFGSNLTSQSSGSLDTKIYDTVGKRSSNVQTLPNTSDKLTRNSMSTLTPNNIESSDAIFGDVSSKRNCTDVQNSFFLTEGEYIPPPLPRNKIDAIKNSSYDADADEIITTDVTLTSNVEDLDANDSESYSSLCDLDSKQIEAITDFIQGIVKEKSVTKSLVYTVVSDLNRLFKNHFEGHFIDVYGSYLSNLAITTSDINLVMSSADISITKHFMFEVYKVLSKEQDKYYVHPFEEGESATKTKVHFSETKSGVPCELAYLGKYNTAYKKMGTFLEAASLHDVRIRTLIIATKIWAEDCLLNDIEEGKLHPIGFIMMMIHFLQHHEEPLLPIPINYNKCKIESSLLSTNLSVGYLWVAFLKYFSMTFNWKNDVVTVNSKEHVSKKSKCWNNFWIAIEDPFTEKNIASSVINSDIADFIKTVFKSSYVYFCNSVVDSGCRTDKDSENNEASSSYKWPYSFQQCIINQSEFYCEKCEEVGDVCDECEKKSYTPPMPSVPNMTDDFLKKIRDALYFVYEKYILTDFEVNERIEFVKNLEKIVCRVYPGAELRLYGSSRSGFGFKISDLDICMILKNKSIKNKNIILKDLRTLLKKNKDFNHVFSIPNASTPIVKFQHNHQKWRGDICVNNVLAIHNSELLYYYSLIDERCKILGCALKLLAKKALIAEVTDKALSSYSYVLMVIHFLQQTDPPVLPVLQDRKYNKSEFSLDDIVEGCNVWFLKDYKQSGVKNDTPVEQLWLDLLEYYCSYNYDNLITIRQKEPLLARKDIISARLFNIQDPFIQIKNLGRVVSFKKAREIENAFRRARQLFRKPVKELPASIADIEEYFFSTMSLTGRIQKEALCKLCGKFGHEEKECNHFMFPIGKYCFRISTTRNIKKINPMNRNPSSKEFRR